MAKNQFPLKYKMRNKTFYVILSFEGKYIILMENLTHK